MTIKQRRIRLDKIAKKLGRENIWEEDQTQAMLDNYYSDFLYMRRDYDK